MNLLSSPARRPVASWAFPVLAVLGCALVSCQQAGKRKTPPLLKSALAGHDAVLDDDKVAELQAIASRPTSQLDSEAGGREAADGDANGPVAADTGGGAESDPAVAWARDGLDPRTISPGDIFREQSGAILHKGASLADQGNAEKLLGEAVDITRRTVPVTLSIEELSELEKLVPSGTDFPTRSVALDFRTETLSIGEAELESLLHRSDDAERGSRELAASLASVRSELAAGEAWFVVTRVTRSESIRASYPGAPVGERDADRIGNALLALYPHLGKIAALRLDERVVITRDPFIYWEFEARPLALSGDRFVLEKKSEPFGP